MSIKAKTKIRLPSPDHPILDGLPYYDIEITLSFLRFKWFSCKFIGWFRFVDSFTNLTEPTKNKSDVIFTIMFYREVLSDRSEQFQKLGDLGEVAQAIRPMYVLFPEYDPVQINLGGMKR